MALATRLQKTQSEENSAVDITANLASLQFESALTDEEKIFLPLRKRLHALTVTACAQATFLVNVLNEARQLKKRLKSPQKRSTRILLDQGPRDPLKVGILGCGRLGSQLAHCFITYGNIDPKDLKISTRRPETLEYLMNRGVDCFHDNIKLVTTSHIVFICVLPAQIPAIADEIKADIPDTVTLFSLSSSYSCRKLRQLFGTPNIVKPEYSWDEGQTNDGWDNTINVNTALERQATVSITCPLRDDTDTVIKTNKKLGELMIFMFINMCTHLKLGKHEALQMLHTVVFLETESGKLDLHDFVKKSADKTEFFPPFDLVKVLESNTAVLKRLTTIPGLMEAFHTKYCQIFSEYLENKAIKEMYAS